MHKRFTRRLLAGLLCASLRLTAATDVPTGTATESPLAPAATATETPQPSSWDISSSLRASIGWRENVTLSSFHSINRTFWRGEADSFVVRPFGEDWKLISFLSADVLRYFDPPNVVVVDRLRGTLQQRVSGEQQFVGHLEGRWQPVSFLRLSLKGVGFQQDIFVDPSENEGAPEPPVWVRLQGGYGMFTPRVTLPWGFTLEPSLQVKRIDYKRGYNGDYNEAKPGVRLAWERTDLFVVSVAAYDHIRHYSSLTQRKADGALLNGQRGRPLRLLGLHQHEYEMKAATNFEAKGSWTITATIGRLENRDRCEGFADFNQNRVALEVNWVRSGWHVDVDGEAKRQNFTVQTAGAGAPPPPRIADLFELHARVQRDLGRTWAVFAEQRWERNRSNIGSAPLEAAYSLSYRTDMILVGVQRTF